MDFVTLTRRFKPVEADLIRSRLEAAGLQVAIVSDELGGFGGGVGGILLQVPENQAEEARRLLTSMEDLGDKSDMGGTGDEPA
jgi:hypothetical protein